MNALHNTQGFTSLNTTALCIYSFTDGYKMSRKWTLRPLKVSKTYHHIRELLGHFLTTRLEDLQSTTKPQLLDEDEP